MSDIGSVHISSTSKLKKDMSRHNTTSCCLLPLSSFPPWMASYDAASSMPYFRVDLKLFWSPLMP
jgi:hypothetical protein